MSDFIRNWLRPEIYNLAKYSVPDTDGYIRLDAMENPYSLPEEIKKEWFEYLNSVDINRYPKSVNTKLELIIKGLMNIDDNLEVILGNGSDELIQLLALACDCDDTILAFEPSFVMYEMIAKFSKLNYKTVKLNNDFAIDKAKTIKVIDATNPKIIFISYPNNPTGNLFDYQTIIDIIKYAKNTLVVIDEAYYAYTDNNFINEVNHYPNLVVLRTISKIGFAGLRLGILIADRETKEQLDKIRLPYNISSLTQLSAEFLLDKKQLISLQAQNIKQNRDKLIQDLKQISSLTVFASEANFILFKTKDNAWDLWQFLQKNKVLIKTFKNNKNLENCLRVSIGNDYENKIFIDLMRKYYANK